VTTPTPTRGPCTTWDPIWCMDLTAETIPLTGTALAFATEILYNLSAQQFDECTFTVRPCRQDCSDGAWGAGFGAFNGMWWEWGGLYPRPALFDGAWYNLTCGSCSGSCSCTPLSRAWLPSPVASIASVKLDGATMPASAYRVDDYRYLTRLDGGMWPPCQDLTLPDTADNTWSVTLTVGQAVPTAGRYAVGELAAEIIKSCLGEVCALPRNAVTVTRQGVTIDSVSIYQFLEKGLLGLSFVDMFVTAYNPRRLLSRPQVYDVDGPQRFMRTTWP
jgi:hypothetical protein